MDETTEQELRRMLDEREIERLIIRWARAVDRLDRSELASVYHPDAVEHHGTFDGPANEYVDFVIDTALPRYVSTSHYVTNCLVEVDGDRAHAETFVLAAHLGDENGDRVLDLMNARLVDRLERRDGSWRIAERTVVHDWDMTESIEAVDRWQGVFESGKRGPADFSYSVRTPEA
jgi:ketosteroid isomerase-like protein